MGGSQRIGADVHLFSLNRDGMVMACVDGGATHMVRYTYEPGADPPRRV
jgi:hypothetical protein